MIISDEQARAAATYLRETPCTGGRCTVPDVPDAVLQAAREAVQACPDYRTDRVVEAVERMRHRPPAARDIADKMLSRIVSDSLR